MRCWASHITSIFCISNKLQTKIYSTQHACLYFHNDTKIAGYTSTDARISGCQTTTRENFFVRSKHGPSYKMEEVLVINPTVKKRERQKFFPFH